MKAAAEEDVTLPLPLVSLCALTFQRPKTWSHSAVGKCVGVEGQGHQQGVEGSSPGGHVPDWSPVCGRVFVWKGELCGEVKESPQ